MLSKHRTEPVWFSDADSAGMSSYAGIGITQNTDHHSKCARPLYSPCSPTIFWLALQNESLSGHQPARIEVVLLHAQSPCGWETERIGMGQLEREGGNQLAEWRTMFCEFQTPQSILLATHVQTHTSMIALGKVNRCRVTELKDALRGGIVGCTDSLPSLQVASFTD